MIYKRIFACVMLIACLCFAFGCQKDSATAETKDLKDEGTPLTHVTLRGDKTTVLIDLPFDVKNPPQDESNAIPQELKGILLKAQRYQAGNGNIFMNASYTTFNSDVVSNLSEDKLYESLNGELQENIKVLQSDGRFKDLKVEHQQTKIDNAPAILATATYKLDNKNYKSTLVYIFKVPEVWKIFFDYMQDDTATGNTVQRSVKSIKFQ